MTRSPATAEKCSDEIVFFSASQRLDPVHAWFYSRDTRVLAVCIAAASLVVPATLVAQPNATLARVARVADGDTLTLTNRRRVRLVQIDTPEVFVRPQCFGRRASAITRRLLPRGTLVRLSSEPATDRLDRYGRLLRYVVRARDGLNVNVRLVRIGAAAPYFYRGRRGRYWRLLDRLARRARARRIGLWGACPGTLYGPNRAVQTGPPR